MRRHFALSLAVSLGVLAAAAAGCNKKAETAQAPAAPAPAAPAPPAEPPAPPPLTGFTHQAGFDAQGYYLPQSEVKSGSFRMTNLTLGAGSDFSQWEANKRMATYGPVLIEFEDLKSPVQANEMGQEVHTTSVRVLPDAYQMDKKGVRFKGHDKTLGEISFEGTFDSSALTQARDSSGSPAIVLRGDLHIGQTVYKNIAFTYFAGE